MKKLLSTRDIVSSIEADMFQEDLDYYLSNTVLRGEVPAFFLISERSSHYGAIGNNGQVGYRFDRGDLDEVIYSVYCDFMEVFVGEDRELVVRYYDHDGTSTVRFYAIAQSRLDRARNMLNESHEDIVAYAQSLPVVKFRKGLVD